MATILPFKGVRPAADKVHLVTSRSAEYYKQDNLKHKLETNPFSFLHIINPDFSEGTKTRPGSKERLIKVRKKYESFLKDEILIRDHKPCYYLYQQAKDDILYTGLMACGSTEDYENGIIKKHEQTLSQRESKLQDYLSVCRFNAEPVLFFYPEDRVIDALIGSYLVKHPVYDFTTTDRVRHKLWIIGDNESVKTLQLSFSKLNSVYIADGHHRSASSAALALELRAKNANHSGKEGYNYYLGIFFSERQLRVYDYNRVISDLNNHSSEELLEKIKKNFRLLVHNQNAYKPLHLHQFSMYLDGVWYQLIAKPHICENLNPVEKLDTSILHNHILEPILGIRDPRNDKRLSFVPGVRGMGELKNQVDGGKNKIAFGLFPVSMGELKHIADTNRIMPPKTTWVEPKMRSGLLVYDLEN